MGETGYDEEYFRSHCGLPYHREEPHWLKFFGEVANRIDDLFAPRTVFDAGCAIGLLVETLRARGIEAFGRDFSSYAIGQVPVGLQPFCTCGSIADPIEGTFDLVTCIEVLEHMSPEEGRRAVENMCRIAPRILFSSSPTDFTESTHINVQPPIYWMQLFAEQGFGPKADFDGSFLTPWAIVFERRPVPPDSIELEAQARLSLTRIRLADQKAKEDTARGVLIGGFQSTINDLQARLLAEQTACAAAREAHAAAHAAMAQQSASLTAALADPLARIETLGQQLNTVVGGETALTDLRERLRAAEAAHAQALQALHLAEKNLIESKAETRDLMTRLTTHQERRALFRFPKRTRTDGKNPDPAPPSLSPEETEAETSGLFDTPWYLDRYPDIPRDQHAAVRHFFEFGAAEGRDPNRHFSTRWYVAAHPEVAASGLNPLTHYIRLGSRAGFKPSEDFDPAWYRRTYPDIVKAELEPLTHYLHHGEAEGRRRHATDRSRDVADAMLAMVKAPSPARERVLFVTHAPGGQIKPHLRPYLDALRECGLAVTLIIVAEPTDDVDPSALLDLVDGLFVRENGGFDFAAWAHVARQIDMSGVQLLCLANDSMVGPFSVEAMRRVMDRVRASDADLIGLTDNYEFRHHLQSYFLVAKNRGVDKLTAFLGSVRWLETKQEVIMSYELETLDAFTAAGLTGEALFPSRSEVNRTTNEWRALIEEGFPFIKMIVLQSLDAEQRRSVLSEQGYDPTFAEASIALFPKRPSSTPPSNDDRDELLAINAALRGQIESALVHADHAAARITALEHEVSRNRKRPWRLVRSKLKYPLYRWLATFSPPLSASRAAIYADRAARHDPHRAEFGPSVATALLPPPRPAQAARIYPGRKKPDPTRGNVLVVSHQASRTGAPILALNIGERLSSRYNIFFLCLTGGDLIDDFCAVSAAVVDANLHSMESAHYEQLIQRLVTKERFAFAVVNSVESHAVLRPLHENGVPSVALLHEFASYTGKKSAFPEALRWAAETVFSTRLTLDNAFDNNLMDFTPRLHVLPQGKCNPPEQTVSEASRSAEKARLREVLAPLPAARKRFQVLGAGTVEIRKGVDLFIETATRVLASPGSDHIHFVWIGAGYAPDRDYAYSVYLRDQIQRAGIEHRVTMLPATSEIGFVYEFTDVLLLPSRLDPLPNVGIDALCLGIPVLCFKEATGIADLLTSAGLEDTCVADYIDTADIAGKLLALASSETLYQSVSERTKAYADKSVDLDGYVARLEALALNATRRAAGKAVDAAEIVRSGHFRADFFEAADRTASPPSEIVGDYFESLNWVGAARKPEPGFNPFIYADTPASGYDGLTDAYADFLRKGRPPGPWKVPVLEGGGEFDSPSAASVKAALHIHAYFTDRLPEISERLSLNQSHPDLFISVDEATPTDKVRNVFKSYRGRVVVRPTQNIGRDIAPFLTAFGPELVRDYEVIGHIHVKKSSRLGSVAFVEAWSDFLLENMLGGARGGPMLDRILGRFEQDAKTGLIYPDDPHIFGWTRNLRKAERIARTMGHATLPRMINFPIGTMFWIRAAALKPFIDLGLDWADYPREPLPDDGTDLHALERLFGVVPMLAGWQTTVTNIRGVTR
ncbi:rhamnan synthesis F family protein [Aquabacter spiritensis]|uniref:Methyltransferase family protein n=1 Tax=Aquabacter spiritensis TaxID=933073 RepID=A0A4R3LVY2_9HYPH|nr:rhamnan synthesis F family protein [Aquabacter spiritensis]TCT04734.1 methyltransferase family protein [Aquabacter spiritensis]